MAEVFISGELIVADEKSPPDIKDKDLYQLAGKNEKGQDIYKILNSGALINIPHYPYKPTLINTSYNYIPKLGDYLIGIVVADKSENLGVDINSFSDCYISKFTDFKHASKSSCPNIQCGALLYMIVKAVSSDASNVRASCINSMDIKSWVNYENYLGELIDGCMFEVNQAITHSLLGDKCYILDFIGEDIKYEIAIGHNGRIWIKTDDPLDTNLIYRALMMTFGKDREEMYIIWKSFLNLRKKNSEKKND